MAALQNDSVDRRGSPPRRPEERAIEERLQTSPIAEEQAGGSRFRSVVLPSLFLLTAMFNLTLVVAGLKELIVDTLGGTAYHASLFFSIEMVAYVVFAPIWGVLSDRLGRRRPFVFLGFLGSAVIYAAYGMVESLGLLLVLRFVQGAFSVMGWSILMAMVLDHPDDRRRGRHMGLMGGALALGVSLGAPVGGYVSRLMGAGAPLEVASVLFFLTALGSLALTERKEFRRQVTLGEIGTLLRGRPRLLLPYLFHFVDRYTVGFFVVLFPLYLVSLGVDDPSVRGRYLAFFLFPFALLQYFTGRWSERIGPYKPLLAGSFLYGVLLCAVGYSELYALGPVMFVLGVLASIMFPPSISLTAQLSDAATRGSAMGGFNLAGSLGFATGPLVGTWILERWGYGQVFVAGGVLEIVVVLFALVWLRRWRTADTGRGRGV